VSKNKLGEAVAFPNSETFRALTTKQRTDYTRDDALAYGYAWGRLDQGHPAIATTDDSEEPSNSNSAWAFGALYARMLLELNDPRHSRSFGFSVQGAWDLFAKTGCPEGRLPMRSV
jgi:hypothetical protein